MADQKITELNDSELDTVLGGGAVTKSAGGKIQITSTNGVNIRKEPGGEIIGCAKWGKTYMVLGKSGRYVKIKYGSKDGYVYNGGAGYFKYI